MKIQNLLTGALALAITSTGFSAVTVDITGATAFRAAALDTIKAVYTAGGAFKYAHDRTALQGFNSATRSIWEGTFNGVADVTIRTSFNGSVEGIRALVQSPAADPTYFTGANTPYSTNLRTIGGNETVSYAGTTATNASEAAFSDVGIGSTPFTGLTDNPVGVVVFTMIANDGAPSSLTNITSQGFRALMATGSQQLNLLTGNAADAGNFVFATGRNDGSGTRTAYLAETGYGVSTPVNQYVTIASSSTEITRIQRVPQNGVNVPYIAGQVTSNSSIVWGQNIDGNGGYSSGSALLGDLGKVSPNVEVLLADGTVAGSLPLTLVTWLSLNDAAGARTAGAKILGYDGVTLSNFQSTGVFNTTDREKVTNGHYAAWSFQQFFAKPGTSGDAATVLAGVQANIGSNLATAGIPLGEMLVGRVGGDGGTITP